MEFLGQWARELRAESDQSGYGQRDGQVIHVSEVSRGLACNCFCLKCNARLVARRGLKRRHHFAHHVASDCSGSAETALHLLAKEILQQLPSIEIPPYLFRLPRHLDKTNELSLRNRIVDGGTARIDHVQSEVALGGIVADSMIISGRKRLIVEIAVTHRVEKLKIRKIRQIGLPAIEIHFSPDDSLLTRSELRATIQTCVANKEWIFHPKQKSIEFDLLRQLRGLRKKERDNRRAEQDRRKQMWRQRSALMPPDPARIDTSANGWSWRTKQEFEAWLDRYHRKHGVYPNLDETREWVRANRLA